MKKFLLKFASFLIVAIVILAAFAPVVRAQNLGGTVRISTVPDGPYYMVDGMNYNHAVSAVWPSGSKHLLSVQSLMQDGVSNKARYTFQNWQAGGVTLPAGNIVTVTADPSLTTITANFQAEYALSLVFNSCTDSIYCSGPGTIYVGGAPYRSNQDIWVGPGSTSVLLAVPNAGYVFSGWEPGPGQAIQGALNTVTVNQPVSVYARFQVARRVNLATVPPGLNVYADRILVPTPNTLEWGFDSSHSVGAVSPQQDKTGVWWVFGSWSDGGAPTHGYKVAASNMPDTLTATYVRGGAAAFSTSPPGLKLSIDGRDNWPSYGFVWGGGETHRIEAPARQTDSQGRIWTFNSWSNGGPAAQDFTMPADAVDMGIRLVATYTVVGHMVIDSSLSGMTVKVDGAECTTPCEVERPVGSAVRVSALPSVPLGDASRADFSGWPGSGTANADWSYTLGPDSLKVRADYHVMNRLAAAATPPEGASWRLQPSSSDGYYDAQATVIINVSAQPGFRFRNWSGDLSGTKPVGAVTMSAPRSVQALLDRVPYIAPAGVMNAAAGMPQIGVAGGSVASIFGASLAPDTVVGPDSPLAQTLAGVTVKLGDRLLPLFFVSPGQINVQLPDDLSPGAQVLVVSGEGMPDVRADVTIVRNAPGLFQQVVNEQSFALAFHEDGSPVTTDAPAGRGELLTVYGTGFGPADHVRPAGFPIPAAPAYQIADAASVLIGDAAIAAGAIAAPGRIGVDAVQFRLGEDAPSGTNAALFVRINGQDSNAVLLPVK